MAEPTTAVTEEFGLGFDFELDLERVCLGKLGERKGNWLRERVEEGSGGSGGISPEVGDDSFRPEVPPGTAQRKCISNRVRESLTSFFFFSSLYCRGEKTRSWTNFRFILIVQKSIFTLIYNTKLDQFKLTCLTNLPNQHVLSLNSKLTRNIPNLSLYI